MTRPIITTERLGKRYRLRHQAAPYATLRESLAATARRWMSGDTPPQTTEDFWALDDVSFEVRQGDVVGVIGRNGAGKSTLLKILSRITEPTSGRITLGGRVASLLEVGTGFHPELTGRENIFLNGAILGMTKAEIKAKFDEIVAFAEVDQFLDTPVKHYSSGMYVRLAFAVAAHLEPEILVVDEVLAVGDAQFQKKCLGKMQQLSAGGGHTVLFVSHNIAAVAALCTSALLLRKGRLVTQGSVGEVIAAYAAELRPARDGFNSLSRRGTPTRCRIADAWLVVDGEHASRIDWDSPFEIVMEVDVEREMTVSPEYLIRDNNGSPILFSPTGLQQDVTLRLGAGRHRITAACPALRLATGMYAIDLILAESGVRTYDHCESALQFEVTEYHSRPHGFRFSQQHGLGSMPFEVRVTAADLSAVAPATGEAG